MKEILESIFDKQRMLMEKYAVIEHNLIGSDNELEIPVDLDNRVAQARLRQVAWWVVEELGEALSDIGNKEKFQEELIDALHFLTELAILSGLEPQEITDKMSDDFCRLAEEDYVSILKVIHLLSRSMNCLKNKPWKQTPKKTNVKLYKIELRSCFIGFINLLLIDVDMSPQEIYDAYLGKNKENQRRQNENY